MSAVMLAFVLNFSTVLRSPYWCCSYNSVPCKIGGVEMMHHIANSKLGLRSSIENAAVHSGPTSFIIFTIDICRFTCLHTIILD